MNGTYQEWVLMHIPHDSTWVPPNIRDQFVLSDRDLQDELVRMTDHLTLALFGATMASASIVAAEVSRLVLDVERFEEDGQEAMAEIGMGAIYASTSAGKPLRRPLAQSEREAILTAYYRPHHRKLLEATQRCLAAHGGCLIIDGHSFPSHPLPYEADQTPYRADICIGTDAFHTPPFAEIAFVEAFENAGFNVALNRPFAGAIVPMAFYKKEPRVISVMVEVNRGLYLDEATGAPLEQFEVVAGRIRQACGEAASRVMVNETWNDWKGAKP